MRAIDGKPVEVERYEDERARRLAGREFHLSWAAELPDDNRVLAGRWWRSGAAREFSVETELAALLGIRLGDRLRFQVLNRLPAIMAATKPKAVYARLPDPFAITRGQRDPCG